MLFSRSRDTPSSLLHPQRMNEPIAEGSVIVMVGGVVVYVTDSEGEDASLPIGKQSNKYKPPAETGSSFIRGGALLLLAALSGLLPRLLLLTGLLLAALLAALSGLLPRRLLLTRLLLAALILFILSHSHLQSFGEVLLESHHSTNSL